MSQAKTALVVFAKYPRPGHAKTRLSRDPIQGFGTITPAQAAQIYTGFLDDYRTWMVELPEAYTPFFCVRPGPDFHAFVDRFGHPALNVLEEPTHKGRGASDIGQAMSFTVRAMLDRGFAQVLILGSDLPHFPTTLLEQARAELSTHDLVLGNDGGGCYLVGSKVAMASFESGQIRWSEGTDFATICAVREAQGLTTGVLDTVLHDIDTVADLKGLLQRLSFDENMQQNIPHTLQALQNIGLFPITDR